MKLQIAYYGAPILRKKCCRIEQIDDSLRQLVNDMEETMLALNGIGIAAPQVQHDLALFLVRIPHDQGGPEVEQTLVFINPKILDYSEETWFRSEGCLSIPGVYGTVERPLRITVESTDIEGRRITTSHSDLEARAIMHENDHINGVLFIDRLSKEEKRDIEKPLRELKKKLS